MTSGANYSDEADLLESFMFEQLGVGEYPSRKSSSQLKSLLKTEYFRLAKLDEWLKMPMFSEKPKDFDFLGNIRDFIFDTGFGLVDFSDWMEERKERV